MGNGAFPPELELGPRSAAAIAASRIEAIASQEICKGTRLRSQSSYQKLPLTASKECNGRAH